MPDEQDLSNDERKLEASLARLKAREPMLDPLAIAFEAGRRSAAWRLTTWRAIAAILLVAITVISVLRPTPGTVERIVLVHAVPAATQAPSLVSTTNARTFSAMSRPASPSDAPLTYLHLRQNVIQYGAEALPSSPPAGRAAGSATQLGSWRSQSGDNL